MRENYFTSHQQFTSLSTNPITSFNPRYQKKYTNQKLLSQEPSIKGGIFSTSKTIGPSPHKNISTINQSVKSQQFINIHSQVRQHATSINKISFPNKITKKESDNNVFSQKDVGSDLLAKRSVQILIGLHKGINKTQYSKINRRKEELFKRHMPPQQKQKQETVIHRLEQDFAQDKLIQKYRQLIAQKQHGKPFNMINKLYQIQAIASKQALIVPKETIKVVAKEGIKSVPKEGIKLASTKLAQNKKNREIQYQISKIIHKPSQLKAVKQMLIQSKSSISPAHQNQQNNIDAKQESNDIRKSRESKEGKNTKQVKVSNRDLKREHVSVKSVNKDLSSSIQHKIQKIQTSHRISQPKMKVQTISRIQPSTNMVSVQSKSDIQNQTQVIYPPPKKVTAAAYIVYQIIEGEKKRSPNKRSQFQTIKRKQYSGKIHSSLSIKTSSEIASLTKIMTCIIVIQICEKHGINTKEQKHKVGCFQAFIGGTTAEIQVGDIYTIDQLLKGLMLPSGNDASLALARWAGNVLLLTDQDGQKRKGQMKYDEEPQYWGKSNKVIRYKCQKLKAKRCYNRFIAQMNKKARLLNLQRTSYMNSHGLSNPHNKSSCLDLAMLCEYCVKNNYFCQIVSCKQYSAVIDQQQVTYVSSKSKALKAKKVSPKFEDPQQNNLMEDVNEEQTCEQEEQGEDDQIDQDCSETASPSATKAVAQQKKIQIVTRQISWTNTHQLLQNKQQYLGIKTGVTTTAGPCLASYLKLQDRKFILIVLNSKKLSQRFIDTEILRSWLCKKENIVGPKKAQQHKA